VTRIDFFYTARCAVYCYSSCLCATDGQAGVVCLWVCYHDNSKLHASIFTKLGLYVKIVTISSWLNFGRPAPTGSRSAAGRIFLAPPYYSQRAVFASLRALSSFFCSASQSITLTGPAVGIHRRFRRRRPLQFCSLHFTFYIQCAKTSSKDAIRSATWRRY